MSKDKDSPILTQQFGSQERGAHSPCSAELPHLSRGTTLPSALPALSAFVTVKIQCSSWRTRALSSQMEAGFTLLDSSAPPGLLGSGYPCISLVSKDKEPTPPYGKMWPFPLVSALSGGTERNLNQPEQLRQKPHWGVTSAKDRPTSFYAKIILKRPGDKEVVGTRLPWPSAPTTFTTMDGASGKAFVSRELLKLLLLARLELPYLWWDGKRFPLLPDPHRAGQGTLLCLHTRGLQPRQPPVPPCPDPNFHKEKPETRAAREPDMFQHIPAGSHTTLSRSQCSSA